jgi:hypothetical protein
MNKVEDNIVVGAVPEPTVKIWCELRSRGPPVVGVEIKGDNETQIIQRVIATMVTMQEKTKNWISKEV